MYMNKRQQEGLRVLALRIKVQGKLSGREREATGQFGMAWDICEWCHNAFLAVLGDKDMAESLQEAKEYSQGAREAYMILEHYRLEGFL